MTFGSERTINGPGIEYLVGSTQVPGLDPGLLLYTWQVAPCPGLPERSITSNAVLILRRVPQQKKHAQAGQGSLPTACSIRQADHRHAAFQILLFRCFRADQELRSPHLAPLIYLCCCLHWEWHSSLRRCRCRNVSMSGTAASAASIVSSAPTSQRQ